MLTPSAVLFQPTSGPPPGGLLEGFEGNPLVSTYTWSKDFSLFGIGMVTVTVTRTTSHVTQGSFTWENTGNTTTSFPGLITTTTTNISSYTTVSLDVFVSTISADSIIGFGVIDALANNYVVFSGTGVTGAYTLTFNVADAVTAGVDTTAAYLTYISQSTGSGGSIDYYVDNLRAS